MKPRLAISFSGGRTSAVMTKLCVEKFSATHEIVITFANTGCEHEETLVYVDRCDKHFGWGVVWLEAVVSKGERVGIRHKVVDFATASRKGEPFEAYIEKYGMPGPTHPHCTSRLKEDVMHSYRRSIGWEDESFDTAIGIRSDEIDRVSEKAKERRLVYPLISAGWRKEDVKRECASWPFDLRLKGEHYGNCVWCWKKSIRKLITLAKEDTAIFDFPAKMEAMHSTTNSTSQEPRRFFRGRRKTIDIIEMAKGNFVPYSDQDQMELFQSAHYDVELDTGSACGESCEIGADYA